MSTIVSGRSGEDVRGHASGVMLQVNAGRQQLVSPNYWKILVPKHLLSLPRLQEEMKEIMRDPDIGIEVVPSYVLASKILQHAHNVVQNLVQRHQIKIGLTAHPVHRWRNPGYGYRSVSSPRWCGMKILAVTEHGEAASFLEASLILTWACNPQCLNQATGGEGVSKTEGPFFVYAVFSDTGPS